jgi:hypothetical protein
MDPIDQVGLKSAGGGTLMILIEPLQETDGKRLVAHKVNQRGVKI